VLREEFEKQQETNLLAGKKTGPTGVWRSIGPFNVPVGMYAGLGRINCVVVDPQDTNTLYIGAACGGVWISHDRGRTWSTNTDNLPSLSISDIAVNPRHHDTLYAATGDNFGSVYDGYATDNIFWGGLYSAGVMKSGDGGLTWHTTGLSFPQSNRDVCQKLSIHPGNPDILLAATAGGIYRTADAGATWTLVFNKLVYSMAFHPFQPDIVYALGSPDLYVSYNAGLTWSVLSAGINTSGERGIVAVTPASPKTIWIFNGYTQIFVSHNEGASFLAPPPPGVPYQAGYDLVLGVSPRDSNNIYVAGDEMDQSLDGGATWSTLSSRWVVHPDNHSVAFNPLNPATFYVTNDGGVWRTNDNGVSWTDISNGLAISQVYRMSSSRQNPNIMLCGTQDDGTFYNDGTSWLLCNGGIGDGEDCAIYPLNDTIQIVSAPYGNFSISGDKGATFTSFGVGSGYWVSPVVFNPRSADTFYVGLSSDVYASYDRGVSLTMLTGSFLVSPFTNAIVSLAIAPSNSQIIYAADFGHIIRSTDAGATWVDVTAPVFSDSLPITHIAVDYNNPMLVYVSVSGYKTGKKVYASATGGTTWANISGTLPNVPADCIVTDSSVPGALFVGTDMGVYYTDSSLSGWAVFGPGLPNIIVNSLEINYTNHKIRAGTYGRGIWESNLKNNISLSAHLVGNTGNQVSLYPNPTKNNWKIIFTGAQPATFSITVSDILGRIVSSRSNSELVDASGLEKGVYVVSVVAEGTKYNLKAVKE
jgi:photosystem II stability/assembly factor-like uncharacterized protein